MQNSTLPVEENLVTVLQSFLVRVKVAWELLINPKAIVIINSEINIFNLEKTEVVSICAHICGDMIQDQIQADEINKLVYSN
jgi:hypothetical protein